MKNTKSLKIFLLTLFVTLIFTLTACGTGDTNTGDNGDGGAEEIKDNDVVFGEDIAPVLIFGEGVSKGARDSVYEIFKNKLGTIPEFGDGDSPLSEHEIVFGETDRAVSRRAYKILRTLRPSYNDEYTVSFVIYAKGNSVAIAYDCDPTAINEGVAFDYFINNYVNGKDELKLESGEVYRDTYSVYEYAADFDRKNEGWSALREYVGAEHGDGVVGALRELYSLYEPEMVLWLADLYEPHNCYCGECETGTLACGGGGFYYSNSARDNDGFLPDIESTRQALDAIAALGLKKPGGSTGYAQNLPETMKKQLVVFARYLQAEDGYFYHPQWIDIYPTGDYGARLGRDIASAVGILTNFGYSPRYRTPTGVSGDGAGVVPSEFLVGRLCSSVTVSVSRIVAASIADDFASLDALKGYLEGLKAKNGSNFYVIGSTVMSRIQEIKAADKELGDAGLVSYVIEWFNSHQNAECGLWGSVDYNGVNGLMKISGIYQNVGAAIPNAEKSVASVMEVIKSGVDIGSIVDIYNVWYAFRLVIPNIEAHGGKDVSEAMRLELIANLPELIATTAEQVARFKKEDGSFSYKPRTSSETSQGMPAAIPGSVEGDVNGNVIASSDLVDNIYRALGLYEKKVDIFGSKEWVQFIYRINELQPVIKIEEEAVETYPHTFDDSKAGAAYESDWVVGSFVSAESSAKVVADPRSGAKGNVLHLKSVVGSSDTLSVFNEGMLSGNMQVFEGEFSVNREGTSDGYCLQIFMGSDSMLSIKIESGKVVLYEATTADNNTSVDTKLQSFDFGEWFKLRVEHFTGNKDTVRTKIYINSKLIAVTDSYFGMDKTGAPTTPANDRFASTRIYVMMSRGFSMYMDNIHCYSKDENYSVPTDTSGLIVNADAPKIVVKVTLDPDGGTLSEKSLNLTYGKPYTLPSPKKEGYRFGGWIDNTGKAVEPESTSWIYQTDVTIKAVWLSENVSNFNDFEGGEAGIVNAALNTGTYQGGVVTVSPAGFNNDIYFCVGDKTKIYDNNTSGKIYVFEADFTYVGGAQAGQGLAFVGFTSSMKTGLGNGAMHKCSYLRASNTSDANGATSVELYGQTYERGVTYRVRYEYILKENKVRVYTNGEYIGEHTFAYTQDTVDPSTVYAFQYYTRAQSAGLKMSFDNAYCGIEDDGGVKQ